MTKPARPCAWCGQPIPPDRGASARYCTPQHASKASNARRPDRGPAPWNPAAAC
jgi:predicted nucleic acid-binding Zn ribbon protein